MLPVPRLGPAQVIMTIAVILYSIFMVVSPYCQNRARLSSLLCSTTVSRSYNSTSLRSFATKQREARASLILSLVSAFSS